MPPSAMSIEKTPDLGTKRLRRLKLREISGDTRFVQRATIEPKKPPFQKQKRVLFSVPSETTRPVSLTVKLPALKNTGVDRLADGGSAGFAAGFAGSGEDATNGAKGVATNGARMLLGAPGLTTGNKKLLGVLSRARARARGERTSRAASDGFADGFADPDCKRKNSGLVQPLHHAISEEWIKVDGRS